MSLDYFLSQTRGFRRAIKWLNQRRISSYKKAENLRKNLDSTNLMNFEWQKYSQNGEDGIILEIFNRIGTTNKYFVEFGVEDANECNCRNLLENNNWSGLWIDGSQENVSRAKEKFTSYPVTILDHFISVENIASIFKQAKVPVEFDLLSIDIDGNDYWIWQALKDYSPRVVIIEYNASYPPNQKWIMPYNPKHNWDGTRNYGASLLALELLAKELNYTLVGCDSQGINAFFVRADLINKRFSHPDGGATYHYCCPKYHGYFFGHPRGKGS